MRIGEVARATGLSVRALHHYEELGLLRPARRTARGHREYGDRELLRLQQVLSLRALGLSLREIGRMLSRRDTVALDVIERHVARVRGELAERARLLRRLEDVAARLRAGEKPTAEQLLRAIEESVMIDRPTLSKYFTPEQQAQLVARRRHDGPDRARADAEAWRRAIADVRAARDAGRTPADPALAPVAAQWIALLSDLGADDPEVSASLAAMYRGESHLAVQYGLDGGLDHYVGQMLRAHGWPRRTEG
jgi:DNA-binding transcriptional MerR regulator